jgi:hypothetical protein
MAKSCSTVSPDCYHGPIFQGWILSDPMKKGVGGVKKYLTLA